MSQEISILLSLQTASAITKLDTFLAQANKGLMHLATAALGAYAGFEGFHKLEDGIKEGLALQEQIGRVSEKTGLSIPFINAFRAEAELVNVSFDQLNVALRKFSQNIYDAATKGGNAADVFDKMGIKLVDVNGKLRSTDAVLSATAQWFSAHAASAEKARFSTELFGRAGAELIPILNQGADGIQKMKDAGGPITETSVANATDFEMKLREVHEQVQMLFIVVNLFYDFWYFYYV